MSLIKESRAGKHRRISRHEKEIGIQLDKMENYKCLRCLFSDLPNDTCRSVAGATERE